MIIMLVGTLMDFTIPLLLDKENSVATLPISHKLRKLHADKQLPKEIILNINSPGGQLDGALDLGLVLGQIRNQSGVRIICNIEGQLGSAALEAIFPTCSHSTIHKDTTVHFHQVNMYLSESINTKNMHSLAQDIIAGNLRIFSHFTFYLNGRVKSVTDNATLVTLFESEYAGTPEDSKLNFLFDKVVSTSPFKLK